MSDWDAKRNQMGHSHGSHAGGCHHDHGGHSHHHGGQPGRALAICMALNLGFVCVEGAMGLWTGSLSLLADAAHNLGDVLGLSLAWGATWLTARKPTARHTYGLGRTTILAALGNALLLLVAIGGVAWEAVGRWSAPRAVPGLSVAACAAAGVLVNGISALILMRSSRHDLNMRAAFAHLVGDALVSLAVVAAGLLIHVTGYTRLDSIVSIVVSVVILVGTYSLLREGLFLATDRVPDTIDPTRVRAFLGGLPGVREVHDLHIWPLSTTDIALTAHLVMPWESCPPSFLDTLSHELKTRFGIGHSTIQVEPVDRTVPCSLAPEDVV